MALGDTRNNSSNNNNQKYETSYYSGLRIRNYDNHTAIGIVFSAGLMNIAIQKENAEHKYEDAIKASLTPKKAIILLHQMDQLEQCKEETSDAYGVTLGLGDVQTALAFQIVNGNKHLRIAKVNSDGSIKDQKAFEFTGGTDSGLKWSDFDRMSFSKDVVDDVDYQMLKTAIADFARSSSGALGYGQLYLNRYSESSLNNKVLAIMSKLGIETGSRNNSNYGSGNGFFSNNNSGNDSYSATSEHKTYTQISSMLGEDDE